MAFSQVSNALGTVTPAREMVAMAHRHGARVLVDGAQAVSHMPVDVQALDCDFYVFSGHKIFGPTGIGALYGKSDVLNSDAALARRRQHDRRRHLREDHYQAAPARFEAGTGSIADAVGLGAALDYVSAHRHGEHQPRTSTSFSFMRPRMLTVPGLRLIGTAKRRRASSHSFSTECGRKTSAQRSTGRNCGTRRPSLRPTGPPPIRAARHGATLAGLLQHVR